MNKIFKGLMLSACVLGSAGMLSACGKDNRVQPEKYTLIFDADNNIETENQQITIEKGSINNKSLYPELANQNGFAGEWVKSSQNGKTITFVSNYGDGTENDPYLLADVEDFKSMIRMSYYSDMTGKEYAPSYVINHVYTDSSYKQIFQSLAEEGVERKIVQYGNVDVVYAKGTNNNWILMKTIARNTKHFKLINDIDFSNQAGVAIGAEMSLVLDGSKYDIDGNKIGVYSLKNVSSNSFGRFNYEDMNTNYFGSIFSGLTDSTIKNLQVELTEDCASISYAVNGGKNIFENVVVNSSSDYILMENNKSAFVNYVNNDSELELIDCVNNANYRGKEDEHFGIFVGGAGSYGTSVAFKNCVNNGDVVSSGSAAMFFGDSSTKSNNISVENCVNNGNIIADERSHILAPNLDAEMAGYNQFTEESVSAFDSSVEGVFTQNGTLTNVESNANIVISEKDITLTGKNGADLTAGTYEFVLSVCFTKSDENYSLKRVYIPIKSLEVSASQKSLTVEDVFGDVKDLGSFSFGGNEIDENAVWNEIDGTNYKFTLDQATNTYVVDLNNEYVRNSNYKLTLDVVIKNSEGEMIEINSLFNI